MIAVGEELADHCMSLLHNLKNPARPLLTRRVVNAQLDPRYAPLLIRDLTQQASVMTDSMDNELNSPQCTMKAGGPDFEAVRLGVGIYLFEGPLPGAPNNSEGQDAQQSAQERKRGRKRRESRGA